MKVYRFQDLGDTWVRSFFSSVGAKALTSNWGMIQLRSRVSAVRQSAKPCHANTLVENYKMAAVGAARYSHLLGKASLSDSSNRVPASVWIRLRNLLTVSRETDQRTEGPQVFQAEVVRRLLVSTCWRKEFAYAIFTQGLRVPSISP